MLDFGYDATSFHPAENGKLTETALHSPLGFYTHHWRDDPETEVCVCAIYTSHYVLGACLLGELDACFRCESACSLVWELMCSSQSAIRYRDGDLRLGPGLVFRVCSRAMFWTIVMDCFRRFAACLPACLLACRSTLTRHAHMTSN